MKRHDALIPLSQSHHHSLALCVRILRQPGAGHAEDIRHHAAGLLAHFAAEEAQFASWWPALAHTDLRQRFDEDHRRLRAQLAEATWADAQWQVRFAETLRAHVRFEERELFPALQALWAGEA